MSEFEARADEADLAIEQVLDPGAAARRDDEDRTRLRAKEQRRVFLVNLMTIPEGRLWLKEMLDRFHAFETRFAATPGGMRDDAGTWLMAGEQRCGWWLWEQLDEADPVIASRLRRGA